MNNTFIRRPIGTNPPKRGVSGYQGESGSHKSHTFSPRFDPPRLGEAGNRGEAGWQKFSRITIYLLLFFALFGIFLYVLPRAEVVIVTEKREVTGNFGITLDTTIPEASYSAAFVPALHFSKNIRSERTFPATGSIDIGKRSQGRALFSNRTGLDWPLLTEHGIRGGENRLYHVLADTQIPKATVSGDGDIVPGEIQVLLEADSGGESYNLPQGKTVSLLTVPQEKQDKIFGYVIETVTGGTSQVVTSISLQDSLKAEKRMVEAALAQVLEEFQPKFGDEYLVSDSLVFPLHISTTTLPQVNEPATEFLAKLEVEYGGVAVKKKYLESAIADTLKQKVVLKLDEMLSSDVSYTLKDITPLNTTGYAAKAKLEYRAAVVPQLPLEDLKLGILGKKENKARMYLLSQKGVKDVRFDYQWNLLLSIPDNPKKVILKVQ